MGGETWGTDLDLEGLVSRTTQLRLTDRTPCSGFPLRGRPRNTGVGSLPLLQAIFLTQGSNPGPPHCGQILYHLSHRDGERKE